MTHYNYATIKDYTESLLLLLAMIILKVSSFILMAYIDL